jgi:transposase
MLVMAWSPVRRFNAGWFEVEHPGDYATLISNQLRDGTTGISITLKPADRRRLKVLARDRNTPHKHVWRAEIVLLSADGVGTNEIMRRTGKSKTCVWRWQERFMQAGWRAAGKEASKALTRFTKRTQYVLFECLDLAAIPRDRGRGRYSAGRTANNLTIRRALEVAAVEFIDENGGGAGVRLRNRQRPKQPK